ncbi:MAG: hypothetical protein M0Q13_09780 [Methanothrix sp.]|jgi:hypothetical protein|nr:hypothetical protein [Methanothrix sp.]
MYRKYENFVFFIIEELNKEMETKWIEYNVITITKSYDECMGDHYIAWLVRK